MTLPTLDSDIGSQLCLNHQRWPPSSGAKGTFCAFEMNGKIMPFVLRKVEPRFLCRGHVPAGSAPQGWPVGAELETVANGALTISLKQLASLLTTAEDIFAELTAELTAVADRSSNLRQRLDKVEGRLATVDPKKVPVLFVLFVVYDECASVTVQRLEEILAKENNRLQRPWDYDTPLVESICNLELSHRQGYRDLRPRREGGVWREEYAEMQREVKDCPEDFKPTDRFRGEGSRMEDQRDSRKA
ncbi:Wiskott-Aldrich syndrome protein family member 2 [Melipona quadrifasciata]|uniref:Wiskott-Aldrich syndrome protein family member 2 n=1 Tax=Melipona quadrifasciata TaxID=166423 RepID=A0A0M9A6P5_9HYME|nr:Wiskott-Aldrich syndrome protein family member 2 [Melipona quadrifasciata]